MIALVIALFVSMAFAFAWKFRCAEIMSTNSFVKSTLERSREPDLIVPKPADHASPRRASPDSPDATKAASPSCLRPVEELKFAITTFPKDF